MTKIIDKRGCNEDWKQTLEQGFLAVEKGREILLDYFGHLTQVTEKAQAGLVSEADVKSEKAIVECLLSQFPNHHIIGEEQSFESSHQGPVSIDPSVPTWIIDPLDGTTNYVHRFHVFCISIGLHYQGEVVVGLIDVPKLSRTYFAVKGKGAFVRERSLGQDRKIHVSGKADLKQALLSTGFSSYDEPALEKQLQIFSQLLRETRGIRRAGSAAYDLCMVAEGVFDAYWEKNLSSWDTAAGSLLVREAGGKVTNYCGDDFSVDMNSILASNGSLHAQLTSVLSSAN